MVVTFLGEMGLPMDTTMVPMAIEELGAVLKAIITTPMRLNMIGWQHHMVHGSIQSCRIP